ncbi:MAG: thermonuclease family protein [Propionivibrio sp.]|uniref:thermonuclease family protein n=1 Tax=Propionivibrio sp. TaxID=2212460 RepID=UPI0025F7332A|nr:thermonuclease family protein [Propionivibrio sp.]MBK8893705.1 thermonuclease family protein [Propionivibrio sp.]MBL0207243.1 thermonuclease family protein [Propionivibrio sp.]
MVLIRLLVLLSVLTSLSARAEVVTGQVVAVADGNTLIVLDAANLRHKMRLAGIDAPELVQDFGQQARTSLSALAFNRQATAHCKVYDRLQHELCVVIVDGKDIGLEQVRHGLAWLYQKYRIDQTAQERAAYEHAEFDAKIHRYGLWNSKNPIPPWDWRHGLPEE